MAWNNLVDFLMVFGAVAATTTIWLAMDGGRMQNGNAPASDLTLREAARTASGIYSVSYAARVYQKSPGYRPALETAPVVLNCHPIKKDDSQVVSGRQRTSTFLVGNPPRLLLGSDRG